MVNKIDFYLFKEPPETYLRSACQLVEKLYSEGNEIWIKSPDRNLTLTLDDLLWTFHDTSFIPHESYISNAVTPKASIIISDELLPPPTKKEKQRIFINLCENILSSWQDFAHIIEIIPNEPQARNLARERYKTYQKQNAELNHYEI